MLTAVAPETFQLSVEDPPAEMLCGLASKELIAGGWPEVLMVIGPPGKQPAVNTTNIIIKGINFFIFHLPL
jgi:hypothetical protein